MLNRIFSTDSAKAIKAQAHGYLNAIQYLAPSDMSGTNLCSHASPACIALCLGWFSGQAGMVSDLENDTNEVRLSRVQKAKRFMHDRANYLLDMVRAIDNLIKYSARLAMALCIRLNGSSDIAWEGIRFAIERDSRGRAVKITLNGSNARNIFDHYPTTQFVDYTKNPLRFARKLPANYYLTFSRSEVNESDCIRLLSQGVNVAVVFGSDKPSTWNGFQVIDGDEHDLRHLDPKGGFVIGLSPKGRKAKRDSSGFVLRDYAMAA